MGGCSQRLLSLNTTTVMVVLLLELWLLLGCENKIATVRQSNLKSMLLGWVKKIIASIVILG